MKGWVGLVGWWFTHIVVTRRLQAECRTRSVTSASLRGGWTVYSGHLFYTQPVYQWSGCRSQNELLFTRTLFAAAVCYVKQVFVMWNRASTWKTANSAWYQALFVKLWVLSVRCWWVQTLPKMSLRNSSLKPQLVCMVHWLHTGWAKKTGLFLEVCNSCICWHRIAFCISNCSVFYPE